MNDVIDFPNKDGAPAEDGPYWAGYAQCGACGFEWAAAVPVGDEDHLECPNCHRFWGAAKHAVVPPTAIWRCNCGETLFWLTPEGPQCRRCGIKPDDWI